MECIFGWTKFHNICPLCKVEIKILEKYDAVESEKIVEKIKVETPKPRDQIISDALDMDGEIPIFDDYCLVCKTNDREDEQIVCEKCDFKIAHYQCLGFSRIPEEEWFCPDCTKLAQKEMERDQEKRKAFISNGYQLQPKKSRSKRFTSLRKSVDAPPDDGDELGEIQQDSDDHGRSSDRPSRRVLRSSSKHKKHSKSKRNSSYVDDSSSNLENEEDTEANYLRKSSPKRKQRILDSQDQPMKHDPKPKKRLSKSGKKSGPTELRMSSFEASITNAKKDKDMLVDSVMDNSQDSDNIEPVDKGEQKFQKVSTFIKKKKERKTHKAIQREEELAKVDKTIQNYSKAAGLGIVPTGSLLNQRLNIFGNKSLMAPGGVSLLNRTPVFSNILGTGPVNQGPINPFGDQSFGVFDAYRANKANPFEELQKEKDK